MLKNRINLIVPMALLVGMIWLPLARATTFYVNGTTGDDAYDGTSPTYQGGTVGPEKTIQAAINDVNPIQQGVTIQIANVGTYSGSGNKNLTWNPSQLGLTIKSENGPTNCTIDCEFVGGGFYLNYDDNDALPNFIEGLTIYRGYFSGGDDPNGAGIYCRNAHLTITNCKIIQCSSTGDGGGIWARNDFNLSWGSDPYVANCTIIDCSAYRGGAVYFKSTANYSPIELVNSTIGPDPYDDDYLNMASYGAGIYIDKGILNAEGCTITGNYASAAGGGIDAHKAIVHLDHCVVTKNVASYYEGGGIRLENMDSVSSIRNTYIAENSAGINNPWGGGISIGYEAQNDLGVTCLPLPCFSV